MILRAGLLFMGLTIVLCLSAGMLFHYTGVLVVDVNDKVHDHHVYLPVPMLLVRGAIRAIPGKVQFHAPAELRQNRDMIVTAAKALQDCPDGNFVEIETPREHVRINKANGNFYIDVITEQEEVHIQVPITASGATLADLAAFQ